MLGDNNQEYLSSYYSAVNENPRLLSEPQGKNPKPVGQHLYAI